MYKKRRSTSFSTHRKLTIAEGSHFSHHPITMAAPMFCHLHLVHAARKQRHEGQTNATKATDYAEEDSRGSASRVAALLTTACSLSTVKSWAVLKFPHNEALAKKP